jgi:hypothetical protein
MKHLFAVTVRSTNDTTGAAQSVPKTFTVRVDGWCVLLKNLRITCGYLDICVYVSLCVSLYVLLALRQAEKGK